MCLHAKRQNISKMKNNTKKLDTKLVENILVRENKFLSELFSIVPVPTHEQEEEGTTYIGPGPPSHTN